ncbi:MAG: hypothetical protein ONB48_20485 [candidate division KSB1 bacterium]|nr:hypothetical protein [candidate division KSB1 bacterium]MDZ7273365.1 hypothetical protein [candidate division KSB1 bacterium]MDZ7288027.1 hypothetical protein [candidate division KSB1 bacterium]MDZ7300121.1 hypothetical protein [candidate division KSB1 bacterium]MDZ7308887.1 hypothetical protein [candidate division KSB1 bacterium]
MAAQKDARKILSKLAHDLRNRVNTAQLNLEAAGLLAGKLTGPQAERLQQHLRIVADELSKLQAAVVQATEQL